MSNIKNNEKIKRNGSGLEDLELILCSLSLSDTSDSNSQIDSTSNSSIQIDSESDSSSEEDSTSDSSSQVDSTSDSSSQVDSTSDTSSQVDSTSDSSSEEYSTSDSSSIVYSTSDSSSQIDSTSDSSSQIDSVSNSSDEEEPEKIEDCLLGTINLLKNEKNKLARILTCFKSNEDSLKEQVLKVIMKNENVVLIHEGNVYYLTKALGATNYIRWNSDYEEVEVSTLPTNIINTRGSRRPDIVYYYKNHPKIFIIIELKFFHMKALNLWSYLLTGFKGIFTNNNYNDKKVEAREQLITQQELISSVSNKSPSIINFMVLCYKHTKYSDIKAVSNFGMYIEVVD